MIRILVVEDQALVREAIGQLLSFEETIQVVGLAENGADALSILKEQTIDVVLSDIEMPVMNGLEFAEHIASAQNSGAYGNTKVIIMTTFSKSGYIQRAMALGVKGFVLKEATSAELVSAIHKVMQGQRVIDPELALMAMGESDPLSEKERRALALAGEGHKTAEIAKKMHLSEGTIRNYLSEAISKLNASNRVDAARVAKQKGWIY